MINSFDERFIEKKNQLRDTEARVAQWIIENSSKVLGMTTTQLAKMCGVSESTIVRTCQSLGYSGFRELRVSLAMDIGNKHKIGGFQSDLKINEIYIEDDIQTIIQKLFNLYQQGLADTLAQFDYDAFNGAVNAIDKARRVEIYALGSLSDIAKYTKMTFMETDLNCFARTDYVEQVHGAATVSSDDVVLVMTNSGELKPIINVANIAKNRGATIIGITNSKESELAKMADYILLAKGNSYIICSQSIRHRVVSAKVAYRPIIDCLMIGLFLKHPDNTIRNMLAIRSAHDLLL